MANVFDETFKNHAIHAQLTLLTDKIQEIDKTDLSKENTDKLNRIALVVAALNDWIERTDPAFVALQTLENLNSYLSNVTSQLTNFVNNGDVSHITNAMTDVDNILIIWHQLYAPRKTADLQGIRQSAVSYRQALEDELAAFKSTAEENLSKLIEEKVLLEQRFTELETQRSETESEISSQKKRLDDAITEFQTQFSKSENSRRKEFEKEKQSRDTTELERKDQFGNMIKDGREQIKNAENDFKVAGDNFLQDIETYKKEIDAMLGIVSEKVITNDYIRRATQENRRSIFWLSASGFLFLGFIAWAFYVFYTVLQDDAISYPRLISKLAVTAVIGVVAKWTTRQANLHREEERRSQRLALALATISPYLKDMDAPQQNEIKGRLSERLFGRIDEIRVRGKSESSDDSFSALKTVTDFVHDLADVFQKKA